MYKNKPLPGTGFNYEHPLFPLKTASTGAPNASGGAILPLLEGSGKPRLYVAAWNGTTVDSITERTCTLTGGTWGYGTSQWGGPAVNMTAASNDLNLGINTDFVLLDRTTIVIGYRPRSTTAGKIFAKAGGTTSQVVMADMNPSTKVVNFYFGGTTVGTDTIQVTTPYPIGDDVWVFSTGQRGMEIWQNGSLIASQTNHATRSGNTNDFVLGNTAFWGGGVPADIAFLYVYVDQIPQDDIRQISIDPFCFYEDYQDIYYINPFNASAGMFFPMVGL